MKLENGKKYERKQEIIVYNNQKRKWIIFLIYYPIINILGYLIDFIAFAFILGWTSYMLLTVINDFYRDKTTKWYKIHLYPFNIKK